MAEGTPLDSILDDSEPVETQVETTPEPQPEPDGPVRDDKGRFAPKETGEEPPKEPEPPEPAAEAPPAAEDSRSTGLLAAKQDETRKRQAAEAERDEFRRQLESLTQKIQQLEQPKEPPAPPPSLWEDEQGWQNHFGSQVVQQASLNATLNMSEMLTRRDHADFDDMKARFLQMAEQNPAIVQQALSDPDPWRKAYQIASNAATIEQLGATNLDELRAKIREEVLAEAQAQVPATTPTAPPTLTTERSVGQRSGPAWGGPKPLGELLG